MSRFGPGTMMALIFAILIGLGGAYVVREYLKPEEQQVVPEQPVPRRVVVPTAAYDLKPGRRLTLSDIIPLTYTPEAYRKTKYSGKLFMNNTQQLVGRMLKTAVAKGETFAPDTFWPDGTGPGVEHELSPGMVARTLPITSSQEILKFISPGSLIDVLFRARTPAPSQTFTLLRGVKVLAIGEAVSENQQREAPRRNRRETVPSVTVEVSRYQAEWVSVVRDRGDLEVVLRNRKYLPRDTDESTRLSIANLVRLPTGIQAKGMSVYMGNKRQTMVFDRRVVYNDDLLIPTPIPRFPPAAIPQKPVGKKPAN